MCVRGVEPVGRRQTSLYFNSAVFSSAALTNVKTAIDGVARARANVGAVLQRYRRHFAVPKRLID